MRDLLTALRSLMTSIRQDDDGRWLVSGDDPELVCCEAANALDAMEADADRAADDRRAALDLAWANINVLGAPDTACLTAEDLAYCRGIGDALAEIEKLRGQPEIDLAADDDEGFECPRGDTQCSCSYPC